MLVLFCYLSVENQISLILFKYAKFNFFWECGSFNLIA